MTVEQALQKCDGLKLALKDADRTAGSEPYGIGHSNCIDCGVIVTVEKNGNGEFLTSHVGRSVLEKCKNLRKKNI